MTPSSAGDAIVACISPPVRSRTRIDMRTIPVAMRMLRRNWSAGELRVLLLALLIAVASVTTVGFFADRVQAALDQQANELLGADLAVIADHRLRPAFRGAAARGHPAVATDPPLPR